MQCSVGGVGMGDSWNPMYGPPFNGSWLLANGPGHSCRWDGVHDGYPHINFWAEALQSRVLVSGPYLQGHFSATILEPCRFRFEDPHKKPSDYSFYGGFCQITSKCTVFAHIESLTPLQGPDPRADVFVRDADHSVVRYVNTQDGTNFKMAIDLGVPSV